ncbi:hypothetical protein LTS15_007771 [Exophiala xenobiotica]|nr:hypothetical protein LTS15_007771 [Exophiala xenobiotica]
MPSRNSTSSTGAPTEVNGDISMISNATAASSTSHAHPNPSSRPSRPSGGAKQDDGVSIDDLLLPRSLVSRLARGVLPANTSIQKDATLALAKSATVFISYLTHHANEQTSKKTIGPQDVIKALSEIEMSGVMGLGAGAGSAGKDGPRLGARLEKELEAYEEIVRGKRKGYRDKVKARESLGDGGQEEEGDRGEPTNKKVRRMSEEGQGQGDAEDAEDEERMLEAQLNGAGMDEDEEVDGKGKGRGKGKSTDEMMFVNGKEDVEEGDGDGEDEGDDEHDDDQEEEEDEDEDEEQDEEEDDENENDADGADADEMDQRPDRDGRGSISLMPDGNVEMRSDDESD